MELDRCYLSPVLVKPFPEVVVSGMNIDQAVETFDALWARMHEPLCRFVCNQVSNKEDAEDILQDVFLRIYNQRGALLDPDRLESWMYQIARNRVIDHYRRTRRWVDLSDSLPSLDEDTEDAVDEFLVESVRSLVTTLPEPYRKTLILADFDGVPQQALAFQEGIGLSGIKSRVQRARSKVKERLLNCFDVEVDLRGHVLDFRRHCCC